MFLEGERENHIALYIFYIWPKANNLDTIARISDSTFYLSILKKDVPEMSLKNGTNTLETNPGKPWKSFDKY